MAMPQMDLRQNLKESLPTPPASTDDQSDVDSIIAEDTATTQPIPDTKELSNIAVKSIDPESDVENIMVESDFDDTGSMYPKTPKEEHKFLGGIIPLPEKVLGMPTTMYNEATTVDPRTGKTRPSAIDIAAGGTAEEKLASPEGYTYVIPAGLDPILSTFIGMEKKEKGFTEPFETDIPVPPDVVRMIGAFQAAGQEFLGVSGAFANQYAAGIPRVTTHWAGYQYPQAKTEPGRIAEDVAGLAGAYDSALFRVIYGAGTQTAGLNIAKELVKQKAWERLGRGAIGGAIMQGPDLPELNPVNIATKAAVGATFNVAIPPIITGTLKIPGNIGTWWRRNVSRFSENTAKIIKEKGISNVVIKERQDPTYILKTVVPKMKERLVKLLTTKNSQIESIYQDMGMTPEQIQLLSRAPASVKQMFADVLRTGDKNKIMKAFTKSLRDLGKQKGDIIANAEKNGVAVLQNKTANSIRRFLTGTILDDKGVIDLGLYARATPEIKILTDCYKLLMDRTGGKTGFSVYALPVKTADFISTSLDQAYRAASKNRGAIAKILRINSKEVSKQVGNGLREVLDTFSAIKSYSEVGKKMSTILNDKYLEKLAVSSIGGGAGKEALEETFERLFQKEIADLIRMYNATQDVVFGRATSIGVTSKSGVIQSIGKSANIAAYQIKEQAKEATKALTKPFKPVTDPLIRSMKKVTDEVTGGLERFQERHGKIIEPGPLSESTRQALGSVPSKLRTYLSSNAPAGLSIEDVSKKGKGPEGKLAASVSEEGKLAKITKETKQQQLLGKESTPKTPVANTQDEAYLDFYGGSYKSDMIPHETKPGYYTDSAGRLYNEKSMNSVVKGEQNYIKLQNKKMQEVWDEVMLNPVKRAKKLASWGIEDKGYSTPEELVSAIKAKQAQIKTEWTPLPPAERASIKEGLLKKFREEGVFEADNDSIKKLVAREHWHGGLGAEMAHTDSEAIMREVIEEVSPKVDTVYLFYGASASGKSGLLADVAESAGSGKDGKVMGIPLVGRTLENMRTMVNNLLKVGVNVRIKTVDAPIEGLSIRTIGRALKGEQFVPPDYILTQGRSPVSNTIKIKNEFYREKVTPTILKEGERPRGKLQEYSVVRGKPSKTEHYPIIRRGRNYGKD